MTKTGLIAEYGDHPVRRNDTEVISVESILDTVDVERFETKQEFHRVVGDVFRREGYWTHAAKLK